MKKNIFNITFVLVFLLLLPFTYTVENASIASPQIIDIAPILQEKYNKEVDTYLQEAQVPGVQIAILLPDNKIYSFARGFANTKTKEVMNTDHIFAFGSVSKVFTAFRIQKFYESGLLKKDDNILNYLGNLVPITKYKDVDIKAEQLITHSSGIKELFTIPKLLENLNKAYSEEEIVKIILNEDLIFQPGTKQIYNNSGFIVADLLMEILSTTPASAELSTNKLLNSLGIENVHSMYPSNVELTKQMPQGYTLNDQKEIVPSTFVINPVFTLGSGHLLGRAKNLIFLKNSLPTLLPKFYANKNMTQSKYTTPKTDSSLKQSIVQLPEKYQFIPIFPHVPVVSDIIEYNLYLLAGINMMQMEDGSVLFGKDGTFPGFSAQFLHDPKTNLTIAILSNQEKSYLNSLLLGKKLFEITANMYEK